MMHDDKPEHDAAERVLVVEDDPDSLDLLLTMLRCEGLRCVGAESGEEALELLREDAFALVITDHNLPEMSGVEMLQQAFTDGLLQPEHAVVCTASPFAKPLKGVAILRKPILFGRLRELVSAARTREPQAATPSRVSSAATSGSRPRKVR